MQLHLLSKHKIQSLSNGPADLILDDIIALAREETTKIIGEQWLADEIFRASNTLKYRYCISIKLEGNKNGDKSL